MARLDVINEGWPVKEAIHWIDGHPVHLRKLQGGVKIYVGGSYPFAGNACTNGWRSWL